MMEMLRDIPCYKAALKAVLKGQIQFLAEQLSSEIDEETVILSASTVDGSVCQLGSRYGKNFLQDKGDIQSQFSKHCLHKKLETPTGKEKVTGMVDSEEVPNHAVTEPTAAHNNAESLSRDETTAEPDLLDQPETVSAITSANQGQDESLVAATANTKPSHSKGHGRKKRKRKLHDNSSKKAKTSFGLNESSERDENDQNDTVNQQAERYVDNVDNVICDTKLDNTGDSENEGMPFKITIVKTDVGIDDDNTVKVEPESDDSGDIDDTGDMSDGENTESIGENMASTSKGDKTPKLEVAEPTTGKKAKDSMSYDESTSDDDCDPVLSWSALNDSMSKQAKTSKKKSSDKPICQECGKTYSSLSHLKRHIKIHLPNTIRCAACHQYFTTEEEKQQHINARHNKVCHICGKTVFRDMQNHMKWHAGTLTPKYSCPIGGCNKKFMRQSFYEDHMNAHTGIKPHECQICSSKFTSRYERNSHFKLCAGLTTFRCDICELTFKHRASLFAHKAAKHSGRIFRCECGAEFRYHGGLSRHKQKTNH